MTYAPLNSTSGSNHRGDTSSTYPPRQSLPAVIPPEFNMGFAPFNPTGGSDHRGKTYIPPHGWARSGPFQSEIGYAPSNSTSGSNHPGNAYLAIDTMPGTVTFQPHMTHTPFNPASGSNHLNDTMNTMYHQVGREFTPPHRYEPQANQNLAFMGMNHVPHHFPNAATLDRPPYERIYHPGATGNPAAEYVELHNIVPVRCY